MDTVSERVAGFLDGCKGKFAGELRSDAYTRAIYSTDASLYQLVPHAVLIPRTTEDVITAVSLAAEHHVPILPRAAGTSLAGQAVNEALVIDFSRHLDAILEINPGERWARVEPGVVLDDLNAALKPHRLQFGPDPASSNRSTVGGAVANNATGSHSLLFGMTADHVLGMNVIWSDGSTASLKPDPGASSDGPTIRIASTINNITTNLDNQRIIREGTPRYWRRCGGYNLDRLVAGESGGLAHLICGSEGTLAVMTEITVNLVPLPASTGLALLQFDRLPTALAAVADILESNPSAVELIDTLSLSLCRDVPEYARLLSSVVDGRPHCLLVVEYQGDSEADVRAAIDGLELTIQRRPLGVMAMTRALTETAQSAVWRVRKVGLGLLMSMKGDVKPVPFIEDAAVPVEHLPDYVRQIEDYCASLDTPVTYYAHAGAGCLHIRPLINRRSALEVARMPDIARFAAGLVKSYGGALSSEHGDGRTRSWLNESFYGPALYALFQQVKYTFDPHNLLNPGIIVDAAPMTDRLRLPARETDASSTYFGDYLEETTASNRIVNIVLQNPDTITPTSGMIRAIEQCNGAGVCRQRSTGTMCPSFMVTRDEEHSTRGRANALRAALSGVLPAEELTSPRMYGVMDLCIACKACKAECPSAVDMARLKTEFLARYYQDHGTPLRAQFFGHSATFNRMGSGWRTPITNAALNSSVGRGLASRLFGLTGERSLPRLAREPFRAWWRQRGKHWGERGRIGDAILVIDPFSNYNHPEVGIAAVEFLERIGVQVTDALFIDEGRAFLSKGLVDAARKAAKHAVNLLYPIANEGTPLVGLEPSSLLTLRDEYHHLLPGDSQVRVVADQALTFEEYVDRLASTSELSSYFGPEKRHVLLHGHCHQKALVGTEPARRILALPPGYTLEEVDSGCCGMAGSFGYEAEHYAISMQMAERRLLPAVRSAAPETIIVAAGVSCREQVAHGSGRMAYHPAQVLRDALHG